MRGDCACADACADTTMETPRTSTRTREYREEPGRAQERSGGAKRAQESRGEPMTPQESPKRDPRWPKRRESSEETPLKTLRMHPRMHLRTHSRACIRTCIRACIRACVAHAFAHAPVFDHLRVLMSRAWCIYIYIYVDWCPCQSEWLWHVFDMIWIRSACIAIIVTIVHLSVSCPNLRRTNANRTTESLRWIIMNAVLSRVLERSGLFHRSLYFALYCGTPFLLCFVSARPPMSHL